MKRIGLILCLLLPAPAMAQCEGGACPLKPYEWKAGGSPSQSALYLGSDQVGGFDHARGVFRRLLDWKADRWSEPCAPPVKPPAVPIAAPVQWVPNFGVDIDKLGKRPAYTLSLNGEHHELSAEEAHQVVENGLPDYTGKLRLTVIGSEAKCRKILDDWSSDAASADVRDKVLASWVPADHWWLKDLETGKRAFKADVDPTIYCQAPGGQVLHRQDGYAGPGDVQAIRKAAKSYDPGRDPDLRTNSTGSGLGIAAVAIGLLLALFKRSK